MQNLLENLKSLLAQDERLVVEGELMKNKIIELALQLDPGLIKMLLSSQATKKHFFQEVDGVLVFDKIKFQRFVSNKAFLPDSYTAFKNKIGLVNEEGDYFSESKEVVLAWPYKDCVLEGGATKEEENREEIFWNAILAADETERLLFPKVLTKIKKHDSKGEHSVTDVSIEDNFIIKGNNLLALYSLSMVFANKIKLIYIDPPYNAQNDSFKYNDSFKKSTWLTYMKNRLEVSRALLSEDGALFVQISDVMVGVLRQLLDEIFKPENFINQLTVKTRSPSGFKTVNLGVFESAEYILVYGKNKKLWKYIPQYVRSDYDSNYKFEVTNINDNPTKWKIKGIEETIAKTEGFSNIREAKGKLGKAVFIDKMAEYALKNADRVFRYTEINEDAGKDTLEVKKLSLKTPDKVFIVDRNDKDSRYVLDGNELSFYKKKLREIDGEIAPTIMLSNIWTDIPWEGIAKEGDVKLKRGKKPERLIKRIIEMSTNEGDRVMDYVLGSGTTAAVAHKLKRKYIGIEQLDYKENDSLVRLKNVIKGDQTGISKLVNWQGGGSFISCELAKANQDFIDKIKAAKTAKELKSIWKTMQEKAFISYKVGVKTFDENADSFDQLNLEDQKNFLIEVLDKNLLYVNYSEIEDKDYNISKEEKKLNTKFYSLK